MKHHPPKSLILIAAVTAPGTTWLQAPLPNCLDTLPILVTIEGQGSGRQGPSPSAPPEPSPNE